MRNYSRKKMGKINGKTKSLDKREKFKIGSKQKSNRMKENKQINNLKKEEQKLT